MSKRFDLAVKTISEGGRFSEKLERQFHGGDKFQVRLFNRCGGMVKGVGFKTRQELLDAGLLRRVNLWRTSVWETRHVAKDTPLSQEESDSSAHQWAEKDWV